MANPLKINIRVDGHDDGFMEFNIEIDEDQLPVGTCRVRQRIKSYAFESDISKVMNWRQMVESVSIHVVDVFSGFRTREEYETEKQAYMDKTKG